MLTEWIYPVGLRRDEEGSWQASSSAMPEAIAWGATREEAAKEMREALTAGVRGAMKLGRDLPRPRVYALTSEDLRIPIRPEVAAKASIYGAWRESGMSKVEMAEKMGRTEREVRRILDPDHPSGFAHLSEAAAALGLDLVVGVQQAA